MAFLVSFSRTSSAGDTPAATGPGMVVVSSLMVKNIRLLRAVAAGVSPAIHFGWQPKWTGWQPALPRKDRLANRVSALPT
jgi:hypothetical protein